MVAERRFSVTHRVLGLLIALVVAGDVATIAVRRHDGGAAAQLLRAAPTAVTPSTVPVPSSVLLRDDFSGSTAFSSDESDSHAAATGDGQYRLRFKRSVDMYYALPERAPEYSTIQQSKT